MSHLVGLTVENYKRISLVKLKFERGKGVFQIMGENEAGKSTLIDAVAAVFGGKRWDDEMPLRRGATKAQVIAETEDLIITARWTGKSRKVTVENRSDGARHRSAQEVLDALYASLALDPDAFTRMGDKERAALLRQLVGLDTSKFDADRSKLYDDRTEVGREAKLLQGQLAAITVPPPVDIPEEIDIADVAQKRAEAVSRNLANSEVRSKRFDAQKLLTQAQADLVRLREAVRLMDKKTKDLEHSVAGLLIDEEALVDIPTAQFDETIEKAKKQNKEAQQAKLRQAAHLSAAKRRDSLQKQIDDTRTKALEFTEAIDEIDTKKAEALAACKFPVEGLAVDGDAVTFKGVPYGQISSSEQIRVSLAMAVALKPKLRCVLIRDGDKVYEKKLEIISEWAEQNDVLVLMERRETEGAVGVVLEEGHIRGEEPEQADAEVCEEANSD